MIFQELGDAVMPDSTETFSSHQRDIHRVEDLANKIADDRRRRMLRAARVAREHSCNESGDVWHPGGA